MIPFTGFRRVEALLKLRQYFRVVYIHAIIPGGHGNDLVFCQIPDRFILRYEG